MQSRFFTAASRSCRAFSAARKQGFQLEFPAAASTTGRTADPSIHSGEVEAGPAVHFREAEGLWNVTEAERDSHEAATGNKPTKDTETEPLVPPKPLHSSSPRLESYGVNQPLNPHFEQKRKNSTNAALDDVICAGVDGTPLSKVEENEQRGKYERIEDDEEYFSHHKASPLSEIEMADTRKPITRATDGQADAGADYGAGRDVIGWRPEQLDTAEEALRRGAEIFRQNAMRGDPYVFPHSRVLRELRGEWF